MAVVTVKSTQITNRDAVPRVNSNARSFAGTIEHATGACAITSGDSTGSKYLFCSVPSKAKPISVRVSAPDIGTTTTFDLGLYRTTADGGAVVSVAFFKAAVNVNSGAIAKSEQVNGNVVTLANAEKVIWEHLALASDPNVTYDVVGTLVGAADGTGTVQVEIDYQERRSRLTTFFRLLLCIPHVFVVYVWTIPVSIVTVIAWFSILIAGRYPVGLWRFTENYFAYRTRVLAYAILAADAFPPFSGGGPYSVRITVERPERQSRLKCLFRFVLVIPAALVSYFLTGAIEIVAVVLWIVIVITGRAPKGLHLFNAFVQRYEARFFAYGLLLVDRYPNFEEPDHSLAGQPVSVG